MFKVHFSTAAPLRVLCLGAHSDDIEIGCGGTILRLAQEYPQISCSWVVFSATSQRALEAKKSAALFLEQVGEKHIAVLGFRDGFFPFQGVEIKEYFEQLKRDTAPDLIFTHYRDDLHQDHRLVNELTWNTFRDHLILEYEIPKYDGDLGNPNFFVHLDTSVCDTKIAYVLDSFKTQLTKHWFTEDTFRSMLRIRGIQSGAQATYAEAFYSRKIVL